jgi:hypothetical protein
MRIFQRFVPFGTSFTSQESEDRVDAAQFPDCSLCRNEIVVDIGATCWGWVREKGGAPETMRVIDHHFEREAQFPSASAAVIDLEEMISTWAANLPAGTEQICVVTHQQPDFDALCAITLVEDIVSRGVSGVKPWPGDWFGPKLHLLPPEFRWRYQVAAVASVADQCKCSAVPRHRTLPAILYACMARGAAAEEEEFRRKFFAAVRREIESGRNALTDSVLEHAAEFQAELELLDGQEPAYARDIRRARRSVVNIPLTPAYEAAYAELCKQPLLNAAGGLNEVHSMSGGPTVPVDGVFIRDPECTLFKQFARQDGENSPAGRGFIFTAVVYSQVKNHPVNTGDYFFALNPEAIPGAHLYPIWARLQEAEVRARVAAGQPEAAPRKLYEGRAGAPWGGHFQHPWFDGDSYRGTIVVTPGPGTWIAPGGTAADLSDDPVVRIVTDCFDQGLWTGEQMLEDFGADAKAAAPGKQTAGVLAAPRPLVDVTFRAVSMELRGGTKLYEANLGFDVARRLWRTLAPGSKGVPLDFDGHHVVFLGSAVGCWNRHGLAVAFLANPDGRHVRDTLCSAIMSMAALARQISIITAEDEAKTGIEALGGLLRQTAQLKWQVSQPEAKLAQRFFDSIGFERVTGLVYDLYDAEASRRSLGEIAELQRSAGLLEVMVIGVYALEAAHLFTTRADETHPVLTMVYLIAAPLVIGTVAASFHFSKRGKRKADPGRQGVHMALLAGLFLLLFAAGAGLSAVSHRAAVAEKAQLREEQARIAAEDKRLGVERERIWEERFGELSEALQRIGKPAAAAGGTSAPAAHQAAKP